MTFALVRREATEEMVEEALRHNIDRNVTIDIIESALSASPPLTDEEVDRLCRMMWGDMWWWHPEEDDAPEHRMSAIKRNENRSVMRAFISRIGGNNE